MTGLAALLLSASILTADKVSHSVTFSARATEVPPGTFVEFVFVGPESDRAYESMFVTDARIAEIANAFDEAGIPRGIPVSESDCRFWPVGKHVTIEPSPWHYVSDKQQECATSFVFTGGCRDRKGSPEADGIMPSALFSLYASSQSLLLLNNAEDQSSAYGRFSAVGGKVASGDRVFFTVKWDGKTGTENRKINLAPDSAKNVLASLRGVNSDLSVLPSFSPLLTLAEARACASALSVIDSSSVKINGCLEGEFFYRGFLPDERWRERKNRLTQPLEVRISSPTNVTYTVIEEDWNVEGCDPKLTAKELPIQDVPRSFSGDTCIFFASANEKLGTVYGLMRKLPRKIRNWYVFID